MLNKIVFKGERLVYRFLKNKKEFERLLKSDNLFLRQIGIIFIESLQQNLTSQEKEVRNEVEALRKKLITENLKISPNSNTDSVKDSVRYLAKVASKNEKWGILLMKMISNFDVKRGLEFGTCIGISAAYQAGIMKKKDSGEFISIEGIEARKNLSGENLKMLGLDNVELHCGSFDEILPMVLQLHGEFDFLFIDGDHRYKATVDNFHKVLPHLKENSIVVVDDIKWSDGMKRAWLEIKKNDRIAFTFDLFLVGVCIIGDAEKSEEFKISLW
ncbi:MAG: class I SAM-dependent methyltransferase [Balneolaceae bacterium]